MRPLKLLCLALVFALLAGALCGACGDEAKSSPWMVSTSLGPVAGLEQDGRYAFLGIPYARPPTGGLRFRPPEPAGSWGDDPLPATGMKPPCIQPRGGDLLGSEDCLYLNVWTPDPDARLPVMVWIHGGFFLIGAADLPAYDGGELARRGHLVVVSIQYRLGALGHLAHESLATGDYPGSGNLAFLDQALALQWVQREIDRFGGNPENVTLFGESAGGTSVCTALVSPQTRGLFHRAIIQSQHCGSRTLEVARARGQELVSALGCAGGDVPGCLQDLPARTIVETQVNPMLPGTDILQVATSYQPTIDGLVLEEAPAEVIAAGRHSRVPVLGMSLAEDAFFLLNVYTWEFLDEAGALLGIGESDRQAIATHYQTRYSILEGYPVNYERGMLATDLIILCPETQQLLRLADAQDAPVYRLLFDYAPPGFYKQHGLEIPYVFQNLDLPEYAPYLREVDRWVEGVALDIWTGFARDGRPPALPTTTGENWPEFSSSTQAYLALGENELRPEARLHETECRMFGIFDP